MGRLPGETLCRTTIARPELLPPRARARAAAPKDPDEPRLRRFDDRGKTRLSMRAVDQQTGQDLDATQKIETRQPREGGQE